MGEAASYLGENILLGRAFLQAAFIGTNWNRNISWLAQAPGPGPDKTGLGHSETDLLPTATALEFQSSQSLFRDSWKGYWTPLSSPNFQSTSSTTKPSSGPGLDGGAIASIIVVALALVAFLARLLF